MAAGRQAGGNGRAVSDRARATLARRETTGAARLLRGRSKANGSAKPQIEPGNCRHTAKGQNINPWRIARRPPLD